MIKKKYDINLMKYISLCETITKASVHDAFLINDIIYFIIKEGDIGKAIGKRGLNYRKIEGILKKNIRMIEYNSDLPKFIENVIYPLKLANIEIEPEKIILTASDTKTRGILIGRSGSNLRNTEIIIQRYFDIKEVRVV